MGDISIKRMILAMALVVTLMVLFPLGIGWSMLAGLESGVQTSAEIAGSPIHAIVDFGIWYTLVLLFFVLAGLGLIYRKVVPPLNHLAQFMRGFAAGGQDMTQRISLPGQDEFARLANDFNQFLERMQDTLAQARRHSNHLKDACGGLSQATSNTLDGMMSLHGETDQVATAVTEMAATVEEIAQNTERAAESAKQANGSSLNGSQEVSQTIEAINTLSTEVQQAAETILKLEKSSDEIGTILDVIHKISEQTNLLALNAAIEAARAGESGRGFAVVADEVRLLASRTKEATQEIQSMIEELQSDSRNAVQIMNAGKKRAQASVNQAHSAGAALDKIAAAVSTISDMNLQIATASNEQSTVANSVNHNIVKIAQVADATVGDAQQSASASSELALMADQLVLLMERFELGSSARSGESGNLIDWSSSLSVNIDSVDHQHRRLVDMINELHAALGNRQAAALVQDILQRLLDYTVIHFKDEEDLMKRYGYPELESHQGLHQELLGSALELKERLHRGDAAVMNELMFFLKDWLVNHIQRVDMAYSQFLRSKGAK